MRALDVEQINRTIYRRWRRRRPAELIAWHRKTQADVLKALAAAPAEWFTRKQRSREWPLDFEGHSAFHRMKDIEAALQEGRDDSR
jgi:hypothetical protein